MLHARYLPCMVRPRGLEPPRPFGHSHLKAARLPIPPRAHVDVWDWAVRESRLHPLSCSASLGTYNGWRLPSPLTQALPLDLNRSSVHTRCIRWGPVGFEPTYSLSAPAYRPVRFPMRMIPIAPLPSEWRPVPTRALSGPVARGSRATASLYLWPYPGTSLSR